MNFRDLDDLIHGGAISLFDCDDDINAKFYGNEVRRGECDLIFLWPRHEFE